MSICSLSYILQKNVDIVRDVVQLIEDAARGALDSHAAMSDLELAPHVTAKNTIPVTVITGTES